MENKTNGAPIAPDVTSLGPRPVAPPDVDPASGTVRTRIVAPASGAPPPRSSTPDAAEVERMARRYSREAQLALEGLLYWGMRWPFELMAALVAAGRKWEEEANRPTIRRRVSLYDEEM